MASFSINNIRLTGVSACVPKTINSNTVNPVLSDGTEEFIKTTGVMERRVVSSNTTCASDLCIVAAEKLIADLKWDKADIELLVFVSQSRDYLLPVTSAILQHKLGLSTECMAFDVPLGCSGYVYGMSVIASMMSATGVKKGLLLAGDVSTTHTSKYDKSAEPLFGDAATATAFEFDTTAPPMHFNQGTDGEGYKAIIIPTGGMRLEPTAEVLEYKECHDGVLRRSMDLILDGMDIFSFGITQAPKTVNALLKSANLDKEQIDYFVFHQANLMMNKMIAKKLKLPDAKVPYSLKHFGNTSSASIPITIVTELQQQAPKQDLKWLFCGFGVGLSWATVYLQTSGLVVSDLIEIEA